ncbi:MAG TPA: toll/interleukin-1 receptor domain-containing protein, partial [Conexibacter sp.]|nr:toll/interleukin-1 receptor domain-containing protein [Conexibacter sp.]
MTAAASPKLFVSYRRQGTAIHAGRLYDALAARFGEHNVFMDLEMAPGVDFVEHITTAVGACRVVLLVMGPNWARDRAGSSRLADPEDFVRLEVETALKAAGVTVIPVLVAGAQMPDPEELPAELRSLARRNAFEMTDLKWRYDCTRLMAALDELLDAAPGSAAEAAAASGSAAAASSSATRSLLPLWAEGVAIATGAGMLARLLGERIDVGADPTDAELILTTMARRGVSWAVIGFALAVWLCLRRGEQGRLPQRAAAGLLLGALAGALNGAIWAGLVLVPDAGVSPETVDLVAIAALAATGAVL